MFQHLLQQGFSFAGSNATECYAATTPTATATSAEALEHDWSVTLSPGYSNLSGSLWAALPQSPACVNRIVPAGAEVLATLQVQQQAVTGTAAPEEKETMMAGLLGAANAATTLAASASYPLITRNNQTGGGAVFYQAIKWDNSAGTASGKCGDGAASQSTPVLWSVIDELLTAQRLYPYEVSLPAPPPDAGERTQNPNSSFHDAISIAFASWSS